MSALGNPPPIPPPKPPRPTEMYWPTAGTTTTSTVMVTRRADGREHWVLAAPPHLRRVALEAREIVVDWPAELE